MAGNANSGRRQEKPFRDALRMELCLIEQGQETPATKGSLRWNIRQLLESGEIAAIKEIADRLDGKVPQALVGSDDDPAIKTENTVTLKLG